MSTMQLPTAILGIAAAITLGAMSPGPSFVMVARTSVAESRRAGLAAALGMGVGGVVFASIALLGLLALLTAVPVLAFALKFVGGTYLVYLGYRIWQDAKRPLTLQQEGGSARSRPGWRSFALGLATQLSNPKAAVVYASVFASLLPRQVPLIAALVVPAMVFVIETSWYFIVAFALSSPVPRSRYLASKAWLDRTAGGVMSLLGLKLLFEAQQA